MLLPYYIGEIVNERDNVLAYTPETFYQKKQIKVKTYHEVIEINDDKQTVTVCNRQSGETFEESYDTLILSPGADANSLGFESDIAFTLRNFEDTEAIDQFISETDAHALVVVQVTFL